MIPRLHQSAGAGAAESVSVCRTLRGTRSTTTRFPLITDTHPDALNSNATKTIGRSNQLTGTFGVTSTRVSSPANLMGFVDETHALGIASNINWSHTFNAHMRMNLGYQFSRQSNRLTPFLANRDERFRERRHHGQSAGRRRNWGPPTLTFLEWADVADGWNQLVQSQ